MHLQSAQLDETEHVKSLRKLELFAYGKWSDYRDSQTIGAHQYTELNELQAIKLKQLTIVSLAEQNKVCRRSWIKFDLIHIETCFCLTSRRWIPSRILSVSWDLSKSITSIFSLEYMKDHNLRDFAQRAGHRQCQSPWGSHYRDDVRGEST